VKLLLGWTAVAVVALGVAGDASAREIDAQGAVVSVASVGVDVAYATRARSGCFEVRVWNTADRGVRRFASHCFESTSTGSAVAAVTASEGRALWLTYGGGNIREWSLWTKSRTSRAKRIQFIPRDVDSPSPLVVGSAWEGSLPYALDRTIIVLKPDGGRRFTLTAPELVVALSAHSRGYAAVLADGRVLTISAAGRIVRERAFEPGFVAAAVLAGPGLIVKTLNGLEIWHEESLRRIALPDGARFVGYSEGIVAYASGRGLRLLRLNGGVHTTFRTLPSAGFRAQLGRRGLAYASDARVSFFAWATVASAANR
jgi:hypothetical protein